MTLENHRTDPAYFDEHRWLNDLIKAAEGFRAAMVQTGAMACIPQDKYRPQYDALVKALCPFNYRRHGESERHD